MSGNLKGLGGVVNNAHLIHDQSAGRSSTRLHAPPGGHSTISIGWGAEPAPRRVAAAQLQSSQGPVYSAGGAYQPAPAYGREHAPSDYAPPVSSAQHAAEKGLQPASPAYDNRGFGDSGASSVRVRAPAGGRNSMGSGFGWSDEAPVEPNTPGRAKDAYAEHMHSQKGDGPPATAASMSFGVGSQVIYRQIGKAGIESIAVIVHIEPAASRKDNIRIQFQDGRERNTTEDRLTPA